jgi:hypothetical protein
MVRRSRAQWLEVLAKFEASGESVAKFCARKQISPRTFAWWRWQLRDERRAAPARENVRLIAVDVAAATVESRASEASIRIALTGLDLHVAIGTDVEYVGSLVGALRSRC